MSSAFVEFKGEKLSMPWRRWHEKGLSQKKAEELYQDLCSRYPGWHFRKVVANGEPQLPMNFSGRTYEAERDQVRLSNQMLKVFALMKDSHWRTLSEIRQETLIPEQSVSARLRDFRKRRFGGHTVERRNLGDGLFLYRLLVRQK